ncbi:hypothetical protein JL720_3341 [Aureococcus anophagefferens]|nr:hypothetical protein JL720_3341 [Aureococcus anophagefferens]
MTHKLALALALAPAAVLAQAPSRAILAQEPQESPYELKSQFASDGTPQEMFASGIDPGSSHALRLPERSFADEKDPIQETRYELKSQFASDGTQEIFDLASGAAPGSSRVVPGEHALRPPGRSFADEEDPADARRLSKTVFAPDNDDELRKAVVDWVTSSDDAELQYGPIGEWDTSKVTDMSFLFCVRQDWMDWTDSYEYCVLRTDETFNDEAIGAWDTSSVTSMQRTFYEASTFNSDIGGWDVSKVSNMNYAFNSAAAFDADIGDWDVSSVTSMRQTFDTSTAFNADIGDWDVSKVTDMSYMFYDAAAFNAPIGGWDVSHQPVMADMFFGAAAFDQCLSWHEDFDAPPHCGHPFTDNDELRTAVGEWLTIGEYNLGGKYGPIEKWDVSKVTDMERLFYPCTYWSTPGTFSFNPDISAWDTPSATGTSKVTNMGGAFAGPAGGVFNQPIGAWDVSRVKILNYTVSRAVAFNQPIDAWDVSGVTTMEGTFEGAVAFNQPIGAWDVSKVTDMDVMLNYAAAADYYAFNSPIGAWDVSKVTSMDDMFYGAFIFNVPIGAWDTSSVTSMDGTLASASTFNAPIGDWDTSAVTSLHRMFRSATVFNAPIGGWDVSKVTDMSDAFFSAAAFNVPIGGWDVSPATNYDGIFFGGYQVFFYNHCLPWHEEYDYPFAACDRASLVYAAPKPSADPTPKPTPVIGGGDSGEFGQGDGDFSEGGAGTCADNTEKNSCKDAGCTWDGKSSPKCQPGGSGGEGEDEAEAVKAPKCKKLKSEDECKANKETCEWKKDKCKDKPSKSKTQCKKLKSEDECKANKKTCEWKKDSKDKPSKSKTPKCKKLKTRMSARRTRRRGEWKKDKCKDKPSKSKTPKLVVPCDAAVPGERTRRGRRRGGGDRPASRPAAAIREEGPCKKTKLEKKKKCLKFEKKGQKLCQWDETNKCHSKTCGSNAEKKPCKKAGGCEWKKGQCVASSGVSCKKQKKEKKCTKAAGCAWNAKKEKCADCAKQKKSKKCKKAGCKWKKSEEKCL